MAPHVDEMPRVDDARAAPTGAYPPAPSAPARYPRLAAHPVPPGQPPYVWTPSAPTQPVGRHAG